MARVVSRAAAIPALASPVQRLIILLALLLFQAQSTAPLDTTPPTLLRDRLVRITRPARNVMQSGDYKLDTWVISWDTQERWVNPLMGWAST